MTETSIRQRVLLFQVVMILAFAVLTGRLWSIQILGGARYQTLARDNSIAEETVPAPRGVIYDRQGRILVRNRPLFRATLQPAQLLNETWRLWDDAEWQQVASTLYRIADALRIPMPLGDEVAALRAAFDGATGRIALEDIIKLCQAGELLKCYAEGLIVAPYDTLTVQAEVPPEVAFVAMENSILLPGVQIVAESRREYLYGPLYSHLLGYELPITQAQLDRQTSFTTNRYLPTDRVGTAGLEAGFESALHGTRGLRRVEENVVGRRVRVLAEEPPIPGQNLFLTLDTALQQEVAAALQEGMAAVGSPEGVAIVMNPNTGEILAMVSLPTYDNNLFVGNLDPTAYQQLLEDPQKPMLNRAISGTYPPGSIYKIVPAAGALADGIITRDTRITDTGSIVIPNENAPTNAALAQKFVCWNRQGHGAENVVEALAHSCDVFFYEIAGGYLDQFTGLGVDALAKWSSAFGLGEATRVPLPGEALGLVPTRQWMRLVFGMPWVKGNTYNMSIGQGDLLVTPLQMLNATTAIANGGTIYEPQLVYQVQDPAGDVVRGFTPRVLRHVNVAPEHLALVAQGMLGASTWEDGTANLIFRDSPVHVAGKTGTAEYCARYIKEDGKPDCRRDEEGNMRTHAWFSAFAPYEKPEIALVVFVHGNGEDVLQGSEIAAPIARRITDFYFAQHPVDPAILAMPLPPLTGTLPMGVPTVVVPTAPALPRPEPTLPAPPTQVGPRRFVGSLVRTEESQTGALALVTGRVVDVNGGPLANITLTVDDGTTTAATLTTGADGSFRFEGLDPGRSGTWYVRAPSSPGSPWIALNPTPGQHFIVLFQEEP